MDYEAGDVIVYRTFGGGLRRVRVLERLHDVKRGRPGFDGMVVSGPEKGSTCGASTTRSSTYGWFRTPRGPMSSARPTSKRRVPELPDGTGRLASAPSRPDATTWLQPGRGRTLTQPRGLCGRRR